MLSVWVREMRPLVWVKPYSCTKLLLPAFQWKERRKPRNKWTQLSSGQLILCSFLAFKFHFNNLWCGCLHLTQDVSAKWKVSQFMRTSSLNASSFIRHRLIYHSRKTQRTSRYIEWSKSNYSTLTLNWFVRNRQIKVKQWCCNEKKCWKKLLSQSIYVYFICFYIFSKRKLFFTSAFKLFSN